MFFLVMIKTNTSNTSTFQIFSLNKKSRYASTLQIFWTEIHAIPPLSDPFFCRPKTPIPPIKYTQPTACPWLKVPYRRWVPAWATCWIATKKLRRPPGSRMTKTTKKKPTIQGQTRKDDDENEWTLCEFEYWNAFVSKKTCFVILDLWMNVR